MNLTIINPLEIPEWDGLVSEHDGATFFHSSSWARVLKESYGYTPCCLTLIKNGKLKVLIPFMEVKSFLTGTRGVSLPFTDYCPPILTHGYVLEDLFPQLLRLGEQSGWKHIELRGISFEGNNVTPSAIYLNHTLLLSEDENEIKSRFRSSTKRNIKRSIKEGVEVARDDSMSGLKEFYRLNSLTRRDHGLPPQPFNFFQNLHKHIIEKESGTIFLGKYRGKIIAAIVCLHFGKKAIYKYGASDRRFQAARANNLVMWEAIKHYGSSGYKAFGFGRTEPENKGLVQFKAGWGTQESTINYLKYDLHKGEFVKGTPKTRGFHNTIFSRMPIPALNLLGKVLYRHMG